MVVFFKGYPNAFSLIYLLKQPSIPAISSSFGDVQRRIKIVAALGVLVLEINAVPLGVNMKDTSDYARHATVRNQ